MSQVCVITGGTSGIGRCTAQAMLARGYTVYELSRRAEGVAGMQHIVADVTKEETLAAAVALLIGYALYFVLRVYPRIDAPTTAAITVYALLSIAGLYCAFSLNAPMPEKILYILGIASILFSDTMIAESLFLRQKWAGPLILPTYYLCHILLAASRLVR